MNNVKVRCWQIKAFNSIKKIWEDHVITYPENNTGYDLITCLKCGKVYAVDITKQVYVGPELSKKVKGEKCLCCGNYLGNNYAYYPETFIGTGGSIEHFERDRLYPDYAYSVIIEFPEIYTL